jgi:hypothetical protein
MDPEYQAAQRAYMRYHNMNPIFGISSKYVPLDGLSLCFTLHRLTYLFSFNAQT